MNGTDFRGMEPSIVTVVTSPSDVTVSKSEQEWNGMETVDAKCVAVDKLSNITTQYMYVDVRNILGDT